MEDGTIDYSRFSREDLESALASIDREKYPGNFRALLDAIRDDEDRKTPAEREADRLQALRRARGERMPEVELPMPDGFTRTQGPDGVVTIRRKESALVLLPVLVFSGLFYLLRSTSKDPAPGLGTVLFYLAMGVLGLVLMLRESRFILTGEKLIIRSGIGGLSSFRSIQRAGIGHLVWVEDTSDFDGSTETKVLTEKHWYLLVGGEQGVSKIAINDPAEARWLGQEIAKWAGAEYYRKHTDGWEWS